MVFLFEMEEYREPKSSCSFLFRDYSISSHSKRNILPFFPSPVLNKQSVQISSSKYAEIKISLIFQGLCFDPLLPKIKSTSAQKSPTGNSPNTLPSSLTNSYPLLSRFPVFITQRYDQSSKPRHPNFLRRLERGGALALIGWSGPGVYVKAQGLGLRLGLWTRSHCVEG
jgi:hypothetical protein